MASDANSNSSMLLIYVLVTYKNEDQTKYEHARVVKTLNIHTFRRSRAANSVVGGRVWPKLKPIQAFTVVLVTCKNEEDPFRNEGTREVTFKNEGARDVTTYLSL